jgi:sensor histidine kinase YesM
MKKMTKRGILMFLVQLFIVGLIIIMPLLFVTLMSKGSSNSAMILRISLGWFVPLGFIYFVNFYLLAPFLFFRKRYWLFFLANVLLIFIVNFWMFTADMSRVPAPFIQFSYANWSIIILFDVLVAFAAVAVRYVIRTHSLRLEMEEKQRQNKEAELAWLKNQLNPHFLFNTLNNISSLTQIDPDKAQDSIAQLSDLLRYAMYDSDKDLVPLEDEVGFLENYVSLMQLRCSKLVDIKTDFKIEGHPMVAPLLFVALVENAFKHGVASGKKSFVHLSLKADEKTVVFECDNSNFPKDDHDRSGSGIGVENTRRRLQLLYPKLHEWEQSTENDVYHVKISLKI